MKAVELAEFDLDAVAALTDRQRELDLEAGERVLERVEIDRDHLVPSQIVARLDATCSCAGAEVAENGDAHGALGGPRWRFRVERSEIRGPVVICHVCVSLINSNLQRSAASLDLVDREQGCA